MSVSAGDERVSAILQILARTYPDARCALTFSTPFELLVATILSAQCKDERVNKVTARLFPLANTPAAMAAMPLAELERHLHELGLFHNKARNIIAAAQVIVAEHDGEMPRTRAELQSLPGVGRKTANVVLSNAFQVPALAVDTHVFRVASRLGLTAAATAEKAEHELTQIIPENLWSAAHHWLIHHGRRICHARNPDCANCPLYSYCPARTVN